MQDLLHLVGIWPKCKLKKKGPPRKFPMNIVPMSRQTIGAYHRLYLKKQLKTMG